ncbi:MAG: prepilin-type N-terminal cleavage/methylation domain-containing protein [Verrucomicrobia bacterium]|jgi:prepilin-type N-terminal cleavage/methylation domain-containing protein|nr:prepilin-type N-terminal cleavage/methylation domain-containing protein [Verrucomicrobiota bacterium]
MNLTSLANFRRSARSRRGLRALTLPELLVTVAIFSLVAMATVYGHLFGLRQNQLVVSKLGASDQSRAAFDKMTLDIRAAKIWEMGNGDPNSFVPIPNGTAQIGTALKLCLTADTNRYILYYFNTAQGELRRYQSETAISTLVAQYLTNSMYFRAEDYRGNVQTDLTHKGVINVMLQFFQYQYPTTLVGPNCLYDFYKLEFRVTPHVPDGA